MQIALVTAPAEVIGEVDADLPFLQSALAGVGVGSVAVYWDDASVIWDAFDLVVIKSPWNYSERSDDFLGWLDETAKSARILNCPHLIRWNLDKHYLHDLSDAGVRTVPTTFAESINEVVDAIEGLTCRQLVIKPTVSAGSRNTGLFDIDDRAALDLSRRILELGKTVMVQPAIENVAVAGEHALVLFNGNYSHAVNKGPLLSSGGGLVGGNYREKLTPIEPSEHEVELAHAAFAAARSAVVGAGCDCSDPMPLYGRFDMVAEPDGYSILEAEMFEPSYFITVSPTAADRFAAAVAHRLGL